MKWPAHELNYSLDFECPHGLSGAPLLVPVGDTLAVAGVVYGNTKTQFLLDEFVEVKGEREERHEQYEVYHFGLATGVADLAATCTASVHRDRPELEFPDYSRGSAVARRPAPSLELVSD